MYSHDFSLWKKMGDQFFNKNSCFVFYTLIQIEMFSFQWGILFELNEINLNFQTTELKYMNLDKEHNN